MCSDHEMSHCMCILVIDVFSSRTVSGDRESSMVLPVSNPRADNFVASRVIAVRIVHLVVASTCNMVLHIHLSEVMYVLQQSAEIGDRCSNSKDIWDFERRWIPGSGL